MRGGVAGDGGGDGDEVEDVFTGLADPTRRRILDLLARYGDGTATSLATELPVSRQAVVKHLAVLDRAGLVTAQPVGREVRYRINPGPLEVAARWMSARAVDWDRRLGDIKRLAEDTGDAEDTGSTEKH